MRYLLSSISRQKQKKHAVVVEEGGERGWRGCEGCGGAKGKRGEGVIGEFALGVGKSEVQF